MGFFYSFVKLYQLRRGFIAKVIVMKGENHII